MKWKNFKRAAAAWLTGERAVESEVGRSVPNRRFAEREFKRISALFNPHWRQSQAQARQRRPKCPGRLAAILAALLPCGCTVLTYSSPSGERFTRASLGANTAISSLAVESGTNGIRRVQMEGYRNESTQALSAVTEAAVRAALQGK